MRRLQGRTAYRRHTLRRSSYGTEPDSGASGQRSANGTAEHIHEETDEIFLVLAGRLHLDLPDRTITLEPMDIFTAPRGVGHRPRAEPGTRIVNIEPRGTTQDGTVQGTTGERLT